ncbi:hypothetical protein C8J57DRAFT_1461740 [Mycena rebaudengoi]|nr:hypothetical protein C8J57DRAFT_1461740 [Mycena rebaudengoi]
MKERSPSHCLRMSSTNAVSGQGAETQRYCPLCTKIIKFGKGGSKKPTGAWFCDDFCRENAGGRARKKAPSSGKSEAQKQNRGVGIDLSSNSIPTPPAERTAPPPNQEPRGPRSAAQPAPRTLSLLPSPSTSTSTSLPAQIRNSNTPKGKKPKADIPPLLRRALTTAHAAHTAAHPLTQTNVLALDSTILAATRALEALLGEGTDALISMDVEDEGLLDRYADADALEGDSQEEEEGDTDTEDDTDTEEDAEGEADGDVPMPDAPALLPRSLSSSSSSPAGLSNSWVDCGAAARAVDSARGVGGDECEMVGVEC